MATGAGKDLSEVKLGGGTGLERERMSQKFSEKCRELRRIPPELGRLYAVWGISIQEGCKWLLSPRIGPDNTDVPGSIIGKYGRLCSIPYPSFGEWSLGELG